MIVTPRQEIAGTRYPPVGRCLYCGTVGETGRTLTDEHVIPFALGGSVVLPEASCHKCAKVTGAFEAKVLRGGLRSIKERAGLSSRSKTRPATLPLFCVNGDENRRVDVALEDYPAVVILPHFVGPQIAPFADSPAVSDQPWLFVPQMDAAALREKYGISSWASNQMDSISFGRMLAKIAHGFAVALQGLDSFVPFLPDLILNDRGHEFLRFIGSMDSFGQVAGGDIIHWFQLVAEVAGGQRYLTCHLRLFDSFGAPTYRIVVGQLQTDFNPMVTLPSHPVVVDERSANWRIMISINDAGAEGPAPESGYFNLPFSPFQIDPPPRTR